MRFATALVGGIEVPIMSLHGSRWFRMDSCLGDLAASLPSPATLSDFITMADALIARCRDIGDDAQLPAEAEVEAPVLRAPISRPRNNVFCVGRNYSEHVDEDNRSRDLQTELPKYPQFFTKPPTAIVGPGEDILLHDGVTKRLDYEVELAVVIGKGGRNIPKEEAFDHIFGYTICNDVTARDAQRRHDQWFKGKGLDGSGPLGPWIVHKSALGDVTELGIRLSVNGQPRQSSSISKMIFKIEDIIESLSAGLTLEPGDIIATGTPSGVGYAMDPRQFLQAGDVVRCEIDSIGVLENTVALVPVGA